MVNINNWDCLVDLHIHLDGSVSLESAKDLARLQGIVIPESDDEIIRLLRVSPDCKDLNEFLEKFDFPCSLMQTAIGIERAVINLLSELKEQGVMYTEIRFAPQFLTAKGLTQREVVLAAIKGLNAVSGIEASLILCCMRGADNNDANIETVNLACEFINNGVCAVDLAGAEALFPTSDYAELFAYAKKKGLPFTIHSGEADGPDSVYAALSYDPKRIGHGVRSIEDPELIKKLAEKKIPLELCPTSNIVTCIFDNIEDYPIRQLIDSGIICTINTDDTSVVGTDIKNEFNKLIEKFSLTEDEVKSLLKNSVHSSFADEATKEKLLARI